MGCAMALTGASFAQGLVNWNSFLPTGIKVQTNSTAYSPLFGGAATGSGVVGSTVAGAGNFFYELLYLGGAQVSAPTSLAGLEGWSDAGLAAQSGNSAGTVAGINVNAGATVPWAVGTTDNIVLVGWSADLGTTWGVVSNELATGSYQTVLAGQQGFFGISTAGYEAANGSSPGTTLFSNAAQSQGTPITSPATQLFLLPVPEPTTLALAGLGGLSLLLFRRQRK